MIKVNWVWNSLRHFQKVFRIYYLQLLLFFCIITNQLSNLWKDDKTKSISWSGEFGFSNWFHYWLIFDHYLQYLIYIIGILLVLVFPLEKQFRSYAIATVLLYFGINLIEIFYYMYFGNNNHNFNMFGVYISVYSVGHIIFLFKNKLWN